MSSTSWAAAPKTLGKLTPGRQTGVEATCQSPFQYSGQEQQCNDGADSCLGGSHGGGAVATLDWEERSVNQRCLEARVWSALVGSPEVGGMILMISGTSLKMCPSCFQGSISHQIKQLLFFLLFYLYEVSVHLAKMRLRSTLDLHGSNNRVQFYFFFWMIHLIINGKN